MGYFFRVGRDCVHLPGFSLQICLVGRGYLSLRRRFVFRSPLRFANFSFQLRLAWVFLMLHIPPTCLARVLSDAYPYTVLPAMVCLLFQMRIDGYNHVPTTLFLSLKKTKTTETHYFLVLRVRLFCFSVSRGHWFHGSHVPGGTGVLHTQGVTTSRGELHGECRIKAQWGFDAFDIIRVCFL